MKHKMTISLIVTFVLISVCIILGAVLYPNRSVRTAGARDVTVITDMTEKTTSTEKKQVSEGITTELMEIAKTTPVLRKQSKALNDENSGGTVKKKSTLKASEHPKMETEVIETSNSTTTATETTEAPVQEPTTDEPNKEETTTVSTEEKKPHQTTEAQTTTEETTEREKEWHPAITEKVWIVDVEAWDESITYTDYETHSI